MLLDEFLAAKAPAFCRRTRAIGRAIVHGHCHQKALAGMAARTVCPGRVRGLAVEAPDSGCCGMAGAFGYGRPGSRSRARSANACFSRRFDAAPPDTFSSPTALRVARRFRQFCADRQPLHLAQALNFNHGASASSRGPTATGEVSSSHDASWNHDSLLTAFRIATSASSSRHAEKLQLTTDALVVRDLCR